MGVHSEDSPEKHLTCTSWFFALSWRYPPLPPLRTPLRWLLPRRLSTLPSQLPRLGSTLPWLPSWLLLMTPLLEVLPPSRLLPLSTSSLSPHPWLPPLLLPSLPLPPLPTPVCTTLPTPMPSTTSAMLATL